VQPPPAQAAIAPSAASGPNAVTEHTATRDMDLLDLHTSLLMAVVAQTPILVVNYAVTPLAFGIRRHLAAKKSRPHLSPSYQFYRPSYHCIAFARWTIQTRALS